MGAAVDNHYEFLGLEPSASQAEIEAAIELVSEQAIALVYSSPQRSSDLWERIRHMRRDLLATAEGRQVYDDALRRSEDMSGRGGSATDGHAPAFHQPEASTRAAALVPDQPVRLDARAPAAEEEDSRGIAWPYALVAAAAVLIAVAAALVAREPGLTPARRPVAMNLSQLGALQGSKFVSGRSVTLAWTKVPNATAYHLQIATAPGDPSDAEVFAHGSRTVSVTTPSYKLRVTGAQLYYWRVQARVGSRWQRYTASQHFAVAKPRVTKPVALAPVTGSATGGKHVRLCWSPVTGAIGYRLRVQGQRTRTVSGTCVILSVRPRTYRWSVAALVKGAGVYIGAYSVAAVLHAQPVHHAAHRSQIVRHSSHHAAKPRAIRARRTVVATGHSASIPVQIAVAGTRLAATTTIRTPPRVKTSSIRPSVRTLRRSRRTTVRATRGVRTIRTTVVSSHRAPASVANGRASAHVPRPPSTPTRRRTPVLASPPPPPPPPTHVVAVPPVPAQAVSSSRSVTATSSTVVRPIVAVQNPINPLVSPTSSPATRPTSPASIGTKPAAPTPIPAQGALHGHSDHPDHPVHPAHPNHPGHP